jgi:oxygen-independent coproporphyrinogen-3 oxidase
MRSEREAVTELGSPVRVRAGVGLYIHIPFCAAKCTYCDFNSHSGLARLFDSYQEALMRELGQAVALFNVEIRTVYFGGGTPTIMPPGGFADILSHLPSGTKCIEEVTIEANPATVAPGILRSLKEAGVDRLSLGVQSMNDQELQLLGRIHDREAAIRSVQMARDEGFDNLNVDLIFGLPDQTALSWRHTLEEVLVHEPDHVALYGLTLEPGTRLAEWVERGKVCAAEDDLVADMYEFAVERLRAAGYDHYEISNWALPGKQCHHNLIYWNNESYLGIGAGAWSYWQERRWENTKDPEQYIMRCLEDRSVIEEGERVSREQEIADTLMLGLRLTSGIQRRSFRTRFDMEPEQIYDYEIQELKKLGLLETDSVGIRLTDKGRLLGNEVFERFLVAD